VNQHLNVNNTMRSKTVYLLTKTLRTLTIQENQVITFFRKAINLSPSESWVMSYFK